MATLPPTPSSSWATTCLDGETDGWSASSPMMRQIGGQMANSHCNSDSDGRTISCEAPSGNGPRWSITWRCRSFAFSGPRDRHLLAFFDETVILCL